MKKLSSAQIRQMFLDFFKEKGHDIEPSASLIPHDDPSLLWINSGVATLKKYFDGTITPKNPKIVNAQKSIRTNDIENVGYTARHHTFFEMLGNFSIGDYFKKEAIEYAWEFLTSERWLGFDEDLLSVTVHPEDDEAYDIWLKDIKVPKERIIRLEENFWDIGEGPSGPNTEIFYDRGPEFGDDPEDPELYPGGENARYLEIWNLVFSQFNHNPDDTYTPLPSKNIDTGMGLERVTSIVQNTPTNFETDLFMPIIQATEKLTDVRYGDYESTDTAFKVIADHIRTVTFAIGDGALPSNEGRGYVLRRLIRRAVRFAKELNIEKPFMYNLVAVVGEIMKDFYPEVLKQKEIIENVVKVEEERFHETLNDGLKILTSIIEREKQQNNNIFPGTEVFKLYDTYGFPKELTEEYVKEHGFTIDEAGFEEEMEKQRTRAREAREQVNSMQVQDDLLRDLNVTTKFVGYDVLSIQTTAVKMIKEHDITEVISKGEEGLVILEQTPFYAESGGQIADNGKIIGSMGQAQIKDVFKGPKGEHIHHVVVTEGELHLNDAVEAVVDTSTRNQIIKNHTATHLLHQALKDVLGNHVNQAGSLVAAERLRFDFSHFSAITEEEIAQIEQNVNKKIWESIPLAIEHHTLDDAKKLGAVALFGEKYGDIVRVVKISDYSIELCGGCHVGNTAEIGLFKITAESGIGAGTRRIEAVTGEAAYHYMNKQFELLQITAEIAKTKRENLPERIENLLSTIRELERETESLSAKLAHIEATDILNDIDTINGVQLLAKKVSANDMGQLRHMVDNLKDQVSSGIILLGAEQGEKVIIVAGITKDLTERGFHAGELISEVAKRCGGGGGGRSDMAQAGGSQPEKLLDALQFAQTYVKNITTS